MGTIPRPKPTRLSEKLLQIRMTLGLSQSGMIKRLGLTEPYDRSAISYYERGEREPPLPILLRYARSVGISTDVLIDDDLDLPERLPASQRRALSKVIQRERVETTMDATLTLWLDIESKDKSARVENRVRKSIEKYLKKYRAKSINDLEYDLSFSYKNDEDLDKQVYGLLQAIADEAERQNCAIKFDVTEKNTGRRW